MKLDIYYLRRFLRDENIQIELGQAAKLVQAILDDIDYRAGSLNDEALENIRSVLRNWIKE